MRTAIALRPARPDDLPALRRLAVLDDASPPDGGAHLLAVAGERVVAAVALERDWEAADPFERSAAALELLRARRAQLRGRTTRVTVRGLVKRIRPQILAG